MAEKCPFKIGDRVRVKRRPSWGGCSHPTEDRMLTVGDEFEVAGFHEDPEVDEVVRYKVWKNHRASEYLYNIDWACLELVEGLPAKCTCNLWAGCTCGVFRAEQEKKRGESPLMIDYYV